MNQNKNIHNNNKNNHRNSLLRKIFFIGYGISIFSFFIILITSYKLIKFDLTYIGFSGFQDIFSFSINVAIATTTILGLMIAYNKFFLDSKYFLKQFNLQDTNIKINNYYQHKNEFITSTLYLIEDIIGNELLSPLFNNAQRKFLLKEYNDFARQTITKYFISNLHRIWFGLVHDSDLHIKNNILLKVQELYNFYLSNNKLIVVESLEIDHPKILMQQLGFSRILLNLNSETSIVYINLIVRLCKHTLEFDNQSVKNESELYTNFKV